MGVEEGLERAGGRAGVEEVEMDSMEKNKFGGVGGEMCVEFSAFFRDDGSPSLIHLFSEHMEKKTPGYQLPSPPFPRGGRKNQGVRPL